MTSVYIYGQFSKIGANRPPRVVHNDEKKIFLFRLHLVCGVSIHCWHWFLKSANRSHDYFLRISNLNLMPHFYAKNPCFFFKKCLWLKILLPIGSFCVGTNTSHIYVLENVENFKSFAVFIQKLLKITLDISMKSWSNYHNGF